MKFIPPFRLFLFVFVFATSIADDQISVEESNDINVKGVRLRLSRDWIHFMMNDCWPATKTMMMMIRIGYANDGSHKQWTIVLCRQTDWNGRIDDDIILVGFISYSGAANESNWNEQPR